jgi:hypothetical protein
MPTDVRCVTPDGAVATAPLIVRAPAPASPLLVVASTNTWAAYNGWGGASLYYWLGDHPLGRSLASFVTLRRPNPFADPDRGEIEGRSLPLLLAWLERQGITYELIADGDLHAEPGRLGMYRAVILETHAEYWTSTMIEGLQDFLSRGGALLYLGGDGLHWKTEMRDGGIEVRKPSGVHLASGESGGEWRDLGVYTAAITGVAYVDRAAHTYAPFRVIRPDHWAFAGTGVAAGDLIGETGSFGGASGNEQDRMNRRTPPRAVLLAEGTNPRWGGAQMLWIERADGGRVFAASSITFIGALAHDRRLARVLRNVLDRVLR